jgi:hypothetical protein
LQAFYKSHFIDSITSSEGHPSYISPKTFPQGLVDALQNLAQSPVSPRRTQPTVTAGSAQAFDPSAGWPDAGQAPRLLLQDLALFSTAHSNDTKVLIDIQ